MQNGVLYLTPSGLHILVEDFGNACGVLDVHLVVAGVNPAFDPIEML